MDEKKKTMWFRPYLISILRYTLQSHTNYKWTKRRKQCGLDLPSLISILRYIYSPRPDFECGFNFKGIRK